MITDPKISCMASRLVGAGHRLDFAPHRRVIVGQSMGEYSSASSSVTKGFRVPAGRVYAAVESPRRAGRPRGQRHAPFPVHLPLVPADLQCTWPKSGLLSQREIAEPCT